MMSDGGPFFEDLEVGMVDATAPAVTLTEGLAGVHQAIICSIAAWCCGGHR